MNADARLINAVLLGKQVYNEQVKEDEAAIKNWLDDNLFHRIRKAAESGLSHVDLSLQHMPNCRHAPKQFYIRSYIENIDGLQWGKMGGTNGYNDYVRIKWSKEIGANNE